MKLTVVSMLSAVVAQFVEAPHYVEFKHEVEGEGFKASVNFASGSQPALSVVEKKGEKDEILIDLIVPTNGGLATPFFAQTGNNVLRDKVVASLKEAYAAYLQKDDATGASVASLTPTEA